MPIDSICTGCNRTLRVGDEFEGRQARCPQCQTIYVVKRESSGVDSRLETLQPITPKDAATVETTYPTTQSESSNGIPTTSVSQSSSEMFYVRTPNSATYGPADAATVFSWIAQGRLDDTCFARNATAIEWLSIPAWRSQQLTGNQSVSPLSNPYAGTKQPNYQFGAAPTSANQTSTYLKTGGGVVVLVLGIMSWLLCITMIGGPICGIIAVVMGRNELASIQQGKSAPSEKPFVIAGMAFAVLFLITFAGTIFLAILGAALGQ